MVKTLEGRLSLMSKTAESLTNPIFVALSTLEEGGELVSFRTKMKHVGSAPVYVELQYHSEGDAIAYSYRQANNHFLGTVGLREESDELLAYLSIDKIVRGSRRSPLTIGNGGKLGYVHNGFKELDKSSLSDARYWVPTIINHISQNAERYITKKEGSPKIPIEASSGAILPATRNVYSADIPNQENHEHGGNSSSKSPHFRNPFIRCLEGEADGAPKIIEVSGFFVKTDWRGYETPQVVQEIIQNRDQIFDLYFHNTLLPRLVSAGHDRDSIIKAYNPSK